MHRRHRDVRFELWITETTRRVMAGADELSAALGSRYLTPGRTGG
jgi:hypothetical protein